jgi:ribosome biogenesis protein ERB1
VAVAVDSEVVLINPGVGDKLIVDKTDTLLVEAPEESKFMTNERTTGAATWELVDSEKWDNGIRIMIRHFKPVRQVSSMCVMFSFLEFTFFFYSGHLACKGRLLFGCDA